MSKSRSSEQKSENKAKFPWDTALFTPFWLVCAYVSVAFPHKTFSLSLIEIPMTPLLLFFASNLLLFVYTRLTDKEGNFGIDLLITLIANVVIFLPLPIAWLLLSFYEINPLPSFLAVLIIPVIFLIYDLRDWSKSRKTKISLTTVERIRNMPRLLRIMGFYFSGLFFGYGTITSMSYLFCFLTSQSFDTFLKANPAVVLLGGATLTAGILALSRK